MKKFIRKLILVLVVFYSINLLIGYLIVRDGVKKSEIGIFYPPKRWKDFYKQQQNSIDVVFLGASLCNKSYNPKIFDQLTNQNSFNMGSSIQTVSTSYFVLDEVLKYQKPKVIFLDLFTRNLTYQTQIEGVRYNLNYMKFDEHWMSLFWNGLSFKEKIEYLFPAFSMRDQLGRIAKYPTNNIDTSRIKNLYDNKGYVRSIRRCTISKLKSMESDKFDWFVDRMTQRNMHYLDLIISKCKKNDIKLVLVNSPLPKILYREIDLAGFEKYLSDLSRENNIAYLNLNKVELSLKDTVHFKDHHLNKWGSEIVTKYLANYYLNKFGISN